MISAPPDLKPRRSDSAEVTVQESDKESDGLGNFVKRKILIERESVDTKKDDDQKTSSFHPKSKLNVEFYIS